MAKETATATTKKSVIPPARSTASIERDDNTAAKKKAVGPQTVVFPAEPERDPRDNTLRTYKVDNGDEDPNRRDIVEFRPAHAADEGFVEGKAGQFWAKYGDGSEKIVGLSDVEGLKLVQQI